MPAFEYPDRKLVRVAKVKAPNGIPLLHIEARGGSSRWASNPLLGRLILSGVFGLHAASSLRNLRLHYPLKPTDKLLRQKGLAITLRLWFSGSSSEEI